VPVCHLGQPLKKPKEGWNGFPWAGGGKKAKAKSEKQPKTTQRNLKSSEKTLKYHENFKNNPKQPQTQFQPFIRKKSKKQPKRLETTQK